MNQHKINTHTLAQNSYEMRSRVYSTTQQHQHTHTHTEESQSPVPGTQRTQQQTCIKNPLGVQIRKRTCAQRSLYVNVCTTTDVWFAYVCTRRLPPHRVLLYETHTSVVRRVGRLDVRQYNALGVHTRLFLVSKTLAQKPSSSRRPRSIQPASQPS